MNLVITVSLISIGLALLIGYAYGFRKGGDDREKELTRKHSRIAARQRMQMLYGSTFSRN